MTQSTQFSQDMRTGKKQKVNIVRGRRVDFLLNSLGNLSADDRQELFRAEDRAVACWQVTLAPVFQRGVGPALQGMPAWRQAPSLNTGNIALIMTWGGGGVSFRTNFAYPAHGASFAVAGDNIILEVLPTDQATVFALDAAPSVEGWVAARATPTSYDPLVFWDVVAQAPAVNPIIPWTKALIIGGTVLGATFTLTQFIGPAAVVTEVQAGVTRVPVSANATSYSIAASAGLARVGSELAFT